MWPVVELHLSPVPDDQQPPPSSGAFVFTLEIPWFTLSRKTRREAQRDDLERVERQLIEDRRRIPGALDDWGRLSEKQKVRDLRRLVRSEIRREEFEVMIGNDAEASRRWTTFPLTEQRELMSTIDYLRCWPRRWAMRQALNGVRRGSDYERRWGGATPITGHPTPEAAALASYSPSSQAHVIRTEVISGDRVDVIVDTVPSHLMRVHCDRVEGEWIYAGDIVE